MMMIRALWAGLVLISVLMLAFFRAHKGHAPDNWGTEIAGFGLPLLLALAVAVLSVFLFPNAADRRLIVWTIGIAVASGFLWYWRTFWL